MKKTWIVSALATLSVSALAIGGWIIKDRPIAVMTANAEWTVGELEDKYLYGTVLNVPDAEVQIDDRAVEAEATVVYPNGVSVKTDTVSLDQVGVYTVAYRAFLDNEHYLREETFTVENTAYMVQSLASSVEYGTYTEFGANSEGLMVRLAGGDTLSFAQLLDVSSLTGEENLFELFITPNLRGAADFNKLTVTLTDATDASHYLQFTIRRYNQDDRGINVGYVSVNGNGQKPVGYESGKGYTTENTKLLGTPVQMSFVAAMHEGNAWKGAVVDCAPDSGKCSVSLNPYTMEATARGGKKVTQHIAHLNNLDLFDTKWSVWPSGKAKLSITADELKSSTANFCITEILGLDLQATIFEDTLAPIMETSMTQAEVPNGQVGYTYKIPSAKAVDYHAGECNVSVAVYRDYAEPTPISVSVVNGEFIPTVDGWYTIVYTAKDVLGNSAKSILNVYISKDLGKINVLTPSGLPETVKLGTWVNVPPAEYTGDCGVASQEITVEFDGSSYEITDGFLPEEQGTYTVCYKVTDYIGRVGTAEWAIDATPNDEYVVLDALSLPQIFISDSEYVLPEIYANDYSSGKLERKLCDVQVTDKNSTATYKSGNRFVPSVSTSGDLVRVVYTCDGSVLLEREIPAVITMSGTKIIAKNYLYGEGFETSYKNEAEQWISTGIMVQATAESECVGWTFATPQIADGLNIVFEGVTELAKFDSLLLTLTDAEDSTLSVSLQVKAKSTSTVLKVGDTVVEQSSKSIKSNETYALSYKGDKLGFDKFFIPVQKTVDGKDFAGFKSDLVYVKVDMLSAKAGAGYILRSVCETNITRYNEDASGPVLKLFGDFGGNQSLNEVIEIVPAIACDVFAPNTQMTLTVTKPDGSVAVDVDGVALDKVSTDKSYFIILSEYGKYQATYTAKEVDWVVEKETVLVKTVFAVDEVAPQAKFVNITQTTAKVGDVLVLPELIVRDNLTSEENIRVVAGIYNPMGQYVRFKGEENAIKCAYVGEYVFFVMVFDENNNATTVTHVVSVTK